MERRLFHRVLFEAQANLYLASHTWTVALLDLSLRGALLNCPENFEHDPMQLYSLHYQLSGSDIKIVMLGSLHPYSSNNFGFSTHHMDIDSATELRRLISLNTFDAELLNRDLSQMSNPVIH